MSTVPGRNYDANQLAERLADIRWERGLTLRELAAMAGRSRTLIWKIEQGRKVTRSSLLDVANALSMSLGDFINPPRKRRPPS